MFFLSSCSDNYTGAFFDRFDVQWLKDKRYHVRHNIDSDPNLTPKEKQYLRGQRLLQCCFVLDYFSLMVIIIDNHYRGYLGMAVQLYV